MGGLAVSVDEHKDVVHAYGRESQARGGDSGSLCCLQGQTRPEPRIQAPPSVLLGPTASPELGPSSKLSPLQTLSPPFLTSTRHIYPFPSIPWGLHPPYAKDLPPFILPTPPQPPGNSKALRSERGCFRIPMEARLCILEEGPFGDRVPK